MSFSRKYLLIGVNIIKIIRADLIWLIGNITLNTNTADITHLIIHV